MNKGLCGRIAANNDGVFATNRPRYSRLTINRTCSRNRRKALDAIALAANGHGRVASRGLREPWSRSRRFEVGQPLFPALSEDFFHTVGTNRNGRLATDGSPRDRRLEFTITT